MRAIAPVAAIFDGTKDPLVPPDGGQITVFRKKRGDVQSTDETVRFWRAQNGCSERHGSVERIDRSEDGMHVEKSSWLECRGAPVILYCVVGGGHTWPSGQKYLPAFIVGKVNRDIDAGAEIWAFFMCFQ